MVCKNIKMAVISAKGSVTSIISTIVRQSESSCFLKFINSSDGITFTLSMLPEPIDTDFPSKSN